MNPGMCNEKKGKTMEIVKESGLSGIGGWVRVGVARRHRRFFFFEEHKLF